MFANTLSMQCFFKVIAVALQEPQMSTAPFAARVSFCWFCLVCLIPRANCASCSPVDTDLLMTTIRTYWIRERDTELCPLILLAG